MTEETKPDNIFHGKSQVSKLDLLRELKSPNFLRQIGMEYKLDGKYKRALTPQNIDEIINAMLPAEYEGIISKIEAESAVKKYTKEIAQMRKELKPTPEIIAKEEMLRFFKTVFGL